MKAVKWIVGILVVLVVVVALALFVFPNRIIKSSVEGVLPTVLGVPVTLEGADFSVLQGQARLTGLVIGNPEGFNTENLFRMSRIEVKMQPKSVFSDRIVINRIFIDAPEITFEKSLKGNNIAKLLEQMEPKGEGEPEEKMPEQPEAKAEKGGKKVEIDEFIIQDAKLRLSMTALGGKTIMIPLPTIELKDIGKESGGASPREVIARVLKAISQAVATAVASSADLIGKGAKALTEGALEGAGAAKDLAGEGVEALGKGAKQGVEAVTGVADKGAETATDAAKKVGGAVEKGASKLLGGVSGLLGKDKDEKKDAE